MVAMTITRRPMFVSYGHRIEISYFYIDTSIVISFINGECYHGRRGRLVVDIGDFERLDIV